MAHWKKRETAFAEYGAALTMPGAWQLRPSNDPVRWLYRSADHREHLTISRGELEDTRNDRARTVLLERVVARQRRAVELGFGRVPDLSMGEVEYGERHGVPAAWYSGSAGAAHEFWALMLFLPGSSWTFFYEAFRFRELEAEERALEIFESVKLEG